MHQISELQKVIHNCNVAQILWIKSKKDLILRSSNLTAYQTGAQANFFLSTTVWKIVKFLHHLCKNLTIWK